MQDQDGQNNNILYENKHWVPTQKYLNKIRTADTYWTYVCKQPYSLERSEEKHKNQELSANIKTFMNSTSTAE